MWNCFFRRDVWGEQRVWRRSKKQKWRKQQWLLLCWKPDHTWKFRGCKEKTETGFICFLLENWLRSYCRCWDTPRLYCHLLGRKTDVWYRHFMSAPHRKQHCSMSSLLPFPMYLFFFPPPWLVSSSSPLSLSSDFLSPHPPFFLFPCWRKILHSYRLIADGLWRKASEQMQDERMVVWWIFGLFFFKGLVHPTPRIQFPTGMPRGLSAKILRYESAGILSSCCSNGHEWTLAVMRGLSVSCCYWRNSTSLSRNALFWRRAVQKTNRPRGRSCSLLIVSTS